MTRHHLGLTGAAVLRTRHLLLTEQAIADLVESEAMGAVVGAAGLGKTFAIARAIEARGEPVVSLTVEGRPTMRLVADRLLHAFTGSPARGTRFAMTDELLNRLAERRRLVIVGEAQNLTRDCFEYLRHLHDGPATRFALLFDGGDGCWEVLAREPMLHSRIYRRVAFTALTDADVIQLILLYHSIYAGADPELLVLINDKAAHGRMRAWAAFTQTATAICTRAGAAQINEKIGRATPRWTDAERWLDAHGIRELIVLRAHHLTREQLRALADAATRAGVDELVLVTNRNEPNWPRQHARELASPAALLERDRQPERQRSTPPTSCPAVPRSHPLRLRFDCLQTLAPQDFQHVDEQLNATARSVDAWLSSRTQPTESELEAMTFVALQASDPDQAHVRRCATTFALWRAGRAVPDRTRPAIHRDMDAEASIHRSAGAFS